MVKNQSVQLMRFVFSLLVVGYHVQMAMNNTTPQLFENGAAAVEFFFIIGGYFLARSLEKLRSQSTVLAPVKLTWTLFKQRIKGIIPIHFVAVIFMLLVIAVGSPQEFWFRFIKGVPSIFLLQMFPMHYNAYQDALIVPEWYLSTLLLSFLVIPFLYFFFRKKYQDLKSVLYSVLSVSVIFLGIGLLLKGQLTMNFIWNLRAFLEIHIGMIIAYKVQNLKNIPFSKKAQRWLKVIEIVAFAFPILLAYAPLPSSFEPMFMAITVVGVTIGLTIMFSGNGNIIDHKGFNQFFAFLGSLSLPIYLFHPIVIDAIILFRPTMLTFEVLLGQVLLWTLIVSIVYDGVQRIIQRKKQYHG